MQRKEVSPAQFPGGQDLIGQETGFVIGARGHELLRLDTDAHFVTVAKTGAGKGRSVTIPNLLVHPGSVFSIEIGGATLNDTINYRREILGQKIYVFDPHGQTNEPRASFNILDTLNPEDEDFESNVVMIARSLMKDDAGKEEDQVFFRQWPEALISALLIYLTTASEEEVPQDQRHLPYLAELLGKYGSGEWDELMSRFSSDTGKYKARLNKVGNFLGREKDGAINDTILGIISSASQWLDFASDTALSRYLKKSDFLFSDLRDEKITIYMVMKDADHYKSYHAWLRLMLERAIAACPNRGDAGRSFGYEDRILFMIDEFTQLGKLSAVETGMQTTRQKGITLWSVFQDMSRLKHVYGEDLANSFLGAAACIQAFGVNEPYTARYVSERAGKDIALIPSVSHGINVSTTETESSSETIALGENFGVQIGSSTSDTESWSRSHTTGRSQSVSNAFTSGHSGGGGGSNWSSARTVSYGANTSDTTQKGGAHTEGGTESQSAGVSRQDSVQHTTSRAFSKGYTYTLQYTPHILPKLDVADVYQLLNRDDAQILFISARGGARTIVDGRAYYDQVPMLRRRAFGPDAPALPIPRPLEGPQRLKSGIGGKPWLLLPDSSLTTLAFGRLPAMSLASLEEVKVAIPWANAASRQPKMSVRDAEELLSMRSKQATPPRRWRLRGKKVSSEGPSAHLIALADAVKLEAIKSAAVDLKRLRDQMEAQRRENIAAVSTVKDYARCLDQSRARLEGNADALASAQKKVLEYARRLDIYREALQDDLEGDREFLAYLPEFDRYTRFYYYLRERWSGLAPPQRPALPDMTQMAKPTAQGLDEKALRPITLSPRPLARPAELPQEPVATIPWLNIPDIEAHITWWKTWVLPDAKDQEYGLSEIDAHLDKLQEQLRLEGERFFRRLAGKVRSILGKAPKNAALYNEFRFFQEARSRLVDKVWTEARRDITKTIQLLEEANVTIGNQEEDWSAYLRQLHASRTTMVRMNQGHQQDHAEMARDLDRLHEHCSRLAEANKAATAQRAQQFQKVLHWGVWRDFDEQTKRFALGKPDAEPVAAQQDPPRRPERDLSGDISILDKLGKRNNLGS